MRRATGLIHLLLTCVLIWQGAAGALAAGRMASFDALNGAALCRPGGGDPRSADPQAALDHALCALHCGAVTAAAPPAPPALPTAAAFALSRRDAATTPDAPRQRLLLPPPARGPPSVA